MTTIELLKIILPILIGLAPYAISRWRQRYSLCWAHLPPESMIHIAEEVVPLLSISYKDQPVNNLTQYLFILHNTGSKPLDRDDISRPLTWQAPGKILSARVVKTDPPVELSLDNSGEQLCISWELFNQGCKALIEVRCEGDSNLEVGEVRCEGDSNLEVGKVSGQIRNISRITEKGVHWLREGVMVKIRKEDIEFLNALSRSGYMRRSILRSFHYTDWIASVVYAGIFLYLLFLLSAFGVDKFSILSIGVALVMLIIFFFLKYRNPYTKFLQSIEDQSDSA